MADTGKASGAGGGDVALANDVAAWGAMCEGTACAHGWQPIQANRKDAWNCSGNGANMGDLNGKLGVSGTLKLYRRGSAHQAYTGSQIKTRLYNKTKAVVISEYIVVQQGNLAYEIDTDTGDPITSHAFDENDEIFCQNYQSAIHFNFGTFLGHVVT